MLSGRKCYGYLLLDYCLLYTSPSARSKIRSYFSKMSRSDDLQTGRDKLVHEMRKHGLGISSAQSMRAMKQVAEAMGFKSADDMLVNIEMCIRDRRGTNFAIVTTTLIPVASLTPRDTKNAINHKKIEAQIREGRLLPAPKTGKK